MSVYIEDNTNEILDFDINTLFSDIFRQLIIEEGLSEDFYEAEVDVLICDEEDIRELNNNYREIDAATDVLSFPAINANTPLDFEIDLLEEETFLLGDIAICIQRAISQAEEYGHSNKREMAFLFTHGLLHLLGYDHIDDNERVMMEEKQKKILMALNINR